VRKRTQQQAAPPRTSWRFLVLTDLLQPILDILAEMIAYDGRIGTAYTGPAEVDMAALMREMGAVPGVGLD
jgi:hypothetical protein